jgi:TatD DNase family protein
VGSDRAVRPPPPEPLPSETVDAHTHLDACGATTPELLVAAMDRAAAVGVTRAITVADDLPSARWVTAAATWDKRVAAAVALHPTRTAAVTDDDLAEIERLAAHPRVVAVGETGLDYYRLGGRSVADMAWQRERYRVHIRAARASGLPLVIHTRSASSDTVALLREEGGGQARGVFHCFTETAEVARAALDLGFYISFSGILTFKTAADLRAVAAFVPLDRCLIETDSPYLAPVPYRGKVNSPAYVPWVARQLAEVKGLDVETVAASTSRNFELLFDRTVAPDRSKSSQST